MTATRANGLTTRLVAVASLAALVAATLLALTAMPSDAQSAISVEPLTGRHAFDDDVAAKFKLKPAGRPRTVANLPDASNLAVLKITVQPGARFPWHNHPGPVTVAVTTGELVYVYADDCVQRPYPAGKAFVDPGGSNVHTAFNPSATTETVVIATFLGAPETGPVTLPVDPAQAQVLDDKCGFSAASSSH